MTNKKNETTNPPTDVLIKMPDEEETLETQEEMTNDASVIIGMPIDRETETEKTEDATPTKNNDHQSEDETAEELKKIEEQEKIIRAAIAAQAREDEEPMAATFTLRKILAGDLFSAQLLRNNVGLIALVVLFIIGYISIRYEVQKQLIDIDKRNTQLKDAKYRALSNSSKLTERSRESHVLEVLKQRKDSTLKVSQQPPFIINIPEK